MKKLLVLVAILAAAAACGGAAGSSATGGANPLAPGTQYGGLQPPTKAIGGQPAGGTTGSNPTTSTDVVPVLAGPPVIRQAQLAITVDSGTFDKKLAAVRSLVESEQGYIAGTDAQANPGVDAQMRTGTINFMVPAANFDAT